MKKITFGTDGWRGLIADDFTYQNVEICGWSIASYIKESLINERGVVVGYEVGRQLRMETIFAERIDGELVLRRDFKITQNSNVLVVEDIFDTGLTLKHIREDLNMQKPASLEICALLNKKIPDKVAVDVKYIGFEIEDRFVVGYGLDYAEKYRELPHISCLD